ncbi:hypothetical protein GZH46_01205, partial [Fragariocoptes setiger]
MAEHSPKKGNDNNRLTTRSPNSPPIVPLIAGGITDAEHTLAKQPAEIEAKLDRIVNQQAIRERECKERLIKKLNDIYATKRKEIQKKFDLEAKVLMSNLHDGLKSGFKTFISKASKHYQNILHTYWTYDLARAQNEFLREYRLILQEKDARIEDLSNRVKAFEKKQYDRQSSRRGEVSQEDRRVTVIKEAVRNKLDENRGKKSRSKMSRQDQKSADKSRSVKKSIPINKKKNLDGSSLDDAFASVITKDSDEEPPKIRKKASQKKVERKTVKQSSQKVEEAQLDDSDDSDEPPMTTMKKPKSPVDDNKSE